MVIAISLLTGGAGKEKLEYYQVVELFDEGKVAEYELNVGSGALEYKLTDGQKGKYSVPNVSLFIDDIHEGVVNYNRENPEAPIKYNYVSGSSYNIWLQLLPVILCGAVVIGAAYVFMKKINNSISS